MPSNKKRNTQSVQTRPRAKNSKPDLTRSELVEVRNSKIHGRGVYAIQSIKQGTRIMEYVGERITHAEADRRFWDKGEDDGHTFLFVVNHKTVIDGSHNGNDARYINHRCEPNCETVTEDQRIFIEAVRDIRKGDELGYDYQLTWSSDDTAEDLALYNCRCGTRACRGTMLDKLSVEAQRALDRAKRKRVAARKKKPVPKKSAKKQPAGKSAARSKR
jgi:SET domain-containing protein